VAEQTCGMMMMRWDLVVIDPVLCSPCVPKSTLLQFHFVLFAFRYALWAMHYALCTMRYALCIMRYALCIMHYALSTMHGSSMHCLLLFDRKPPGTSPPTPPTWRRGLSCLSRGVLMGELIQIDDTCTDHGLAVM